MPSIRRPAREPPWTTCEGELKLINCDLYGTHKLPSPAHRPITDPLCRIYERAVPYVGGDYMSHLLVGAGVHAGHLWGSVLLGIYLALCAA